MVTSCYPTDYLTRRVAGSHASVRLILPPRGDAREWAPPTELLDQLSGADLIVLHGAGYEEWAGDAALPADRLVDATAGLGYRLLTSPSPPGGTVPHTWTDPLLAADEGDAIATALAAIDPEHDSDYKGNAATLRHDLEQLHETLQGAVAGFGGQPLATSSPAFGYLGRRYGLVLHEFDFEPDAPPSDEAFAAFEGAVRRHGIETMLWSARPDDEVRARFAASGVDVVFLDPLELPPGAEAFGLIAQAHANVDTLRGLFGAPAAAAGQAGDGPTSTPPSGTPAASPPAPDP